MGCGIVVVVVQGCFWERGEGEGLLLLLLLGYMFFTCFVVLQYGLV